NVQGDEPELDPAAIDVAVAALLDRERDAGAVAGTVATPIKASDEAADPSVVKVVRDRRGCALYFSRARIPFDRDGRSVQGAEPLRHVGLYAYRRAFLDRYLAMPPTPLEQSEQLEQLRILEHGH